MTTVPVEHNVEAQVVGELDARLADERAAAEAEAKAAAKRQRAADAEPKPRRPAPTDGGES